MRRFAHIEKKQQKALFPAEKNRNILHTDAFGLPLNELLKEFENGELRVKQLH